MPAAAAAEAAAAAAAEFEESDAEGAEGAAEAELRRLDATAPPPLLLLLLLLALVLLWPPCAAAPMPPPPPAPPPVALVWMRSVVSTKSYRNAGQGKARPVSYCSALGALVRSTHPFFALPVAQWTPHRTAPRRLAREVRLVSPYLMEPDAFLELL